MKERSYCALITEEELYAWGKSKSWPLPRKVWDRDFFLVKPEKAFRELSALHFLRRKEGILLARFQSNVLPKANMRIPFYEVNALFGLSSVQTGIMKDRYGELELIIEQAPDSICSAFDAWWWEWTEKIDIWDGAHALPELFGLPPPRDVGMIIKTMCEALKPSTENLLSALCAYSRGEPWPCDGILAALCDFGKVLRFNMVGKKEGCLVSELSKKAKLLLDNKVSPSIDDISTLLKDVSNRKEFSLEYVLFMEWKYAMERKMGELDIELMYRELEASPPHSRKEFAKALARFGAFVGFEAFAESYHVKMRTLSMNREQAK